MEIQTFIPPLRQDINVQEIEFDNKMHILLTDRNGVATRPIALSHDFFAFLYNNISGISYAELSASLNNQEVVSMVMESVKYIDECGYLESEAYYQLLDKAKKEYDKFPLRPMLTGGSSYPIEPEEFEKFMHEHFQAEVSNNSDMPLKALILPHIDFNIGKHTTEVYAKAYSQLNDTDADLFVIFGTSHKTTEHLIMLGEKNYNSPIGEVPTDKELLNNIHSRLKSKIVIDDYSHKNEHSIEYQAVLLKYFLKHKNFKILPVLLSFPIDLFDKTDEQAGDRQEFLDVLSEEIEKLGRKAIFIASVDFAHIGKKFGDDFAAADKFDELKSADAELIESIIKCDGKEFADIIINANDKWKICGFAPIYTLLGLNSFNKGQLIDYRIWSEIETESAVSFASIALY